MYLKKAGGAEAQEAKGSRLDVRIMQQGKGQIIFGQASHFRDVFSLRAKGRHWWVSYMGGIIRFAFWKENSKCSKMMRLGNDWVKMTN